MGNFTTIWEIVLQFYITGQAAIVIGDFQERKQVKEEVKLKIS